MGADVNPAEIICLSDYFGSHGPGTGGAGNSALHIAELLHSKGALKALISGFQGPQPHEFPGVHIPLMGEDLRESVSQSRLNYAKALWNAAAAAKVRELLADEDPLSTVICLHQWTRYLSPATISVIRPFRKIIYVHDYFWMCPTGAYFNFNQRRPCDKQPLSAACALETCDRGGVIHKAFRVARHSLHAAAVYGAEPSKTIFAHISDVSRRTMKPYFPENSHFVLNHPMKAAPISGDAQSTQFDLAYFGRVELEKGVAELARASSELNLKLLVVGSGPAVETIRQLHPTTTFIDWVPRDRSISLMKSAKAVVLPSLWPETWGLVVPEALSVGVPVIVSLRAGSSELVRNHGGGEVFDPDEKDGLQRAIVRTLANSSTLRDAALEAFQLARLDTASFLEKFDIMLKDAWGLNLPSIP